MLRRGHIECVWSGISVPVMNGASGISPPRRRLFPTGEQWRLGAIGRRPRGL